MLACLSIFAALCSELPLQTPFMKHTKTRFILILFLVPQALCPDSSRGVRSCRFSPYLHSEKPLDSVGGRSVCQKTSSHSLHIARRPASSPSPKHSTCLFRHQILQSLSVILTDTSCKKHLCLSLRLQDPGVWQLRCVEEARQGFRSRAAKNHRKYGKLMSVPALSFLPAFYTVKSTS